MASLELKGLQAAVRALKARADKAERDTLPEALDAAAEVIRREVETLAPVRTGYLVSTVETTEPRDDRGRVSAEVHIERQDFDGRSYYGAAQEFGTHEIPGRGFMRRAADSKHDAAVDAASKVIARDLA